MCDINRPGAAVYLLIILLFLWPLSLLAAPKAQPEITVMTEHFPPYNYQVAGEPRGMAVEVMQAVLDELAIDTEFHFMPWARAYRKASSEKNVLIFSIARIAQREAKFQWVGEVAPYHTAIYKLSRNPLQIEQLSDAKPYRIGVSQEDVIYTYLRSRGFENLEVIGSDLLNIQKLRYERVPLIAYDEAAFRFAMAGDPRPDRFERVLDLPALSGSLYMAFSLGTSPDVVQRFREALAEVKRDGRYDAILQRYFGRDTAISR